MNFIQPIVSAPSFTCPHCNTVAMQNWWYRSFSDAMMQKESSDIRVGTCHHCRKSTVWIKELMVFPITGTAPSPNPDMPDSVLRLYTEAASVYVKSPRGAAALLRLAIQILCKEVGESGKNINTDISSLVRKGLPEIVQKSLDIVRVTGNDAVHPGQIDTNDHTTVGNLFDLLNIIVEYMIALPKKVNGIYSLLPNDKTLSIAKRDGNLN